MSKATPNHKTVSSRAPTALQNHQHNESSEMEASPASPGTISVAGGIGGMQAGQTSNSKKKIGHREIKDGVVHYKKVPTDELKKSIQFGIVHFINEQNRANSKYNIDRDLLMQDFQTVETIVFPRAGSPQTPAHDYNDFKLKVYAPYGFKYLRRKFNVNEVDFMHALGETDLKEISNPGASGSVFYKTSNDKYILKTVQSKESEFLMTLLAGYALNLLQNLINGRYTLLPTIYGLFCYQKLEITSMLSDKTNIRIVIMNNILPSDLTIHEKYDLKGSLYKRRASNQERSKKSPTFKDLDFLEEHPNGLILDERHYDNVISSLKRDCLLLQSFSIMDYSILLGIHNLEKEKNNNAIEAYYEAKIIDPPPTTTAESNSPLILNQNKSSFVSAKTLENVFNVSAVPARSANGERLLLYLGIIDILQNYRLKKKLEHTFKSMITDGRQVSVCPPNFYATRFLEFMTNKVFKKATLKASPGRRRLTFRTDSNLKKYPNESSTDNKRDSQVSTLSNSNETGKHDQREIDSETETDSLPYNVPPPAPPSSTKQENKPKTPSSTESRRYSNHTNNSYGQSIKNMKPIDSVDSVAAILASTTVGDSLRPSGRYVGKDSESEYMKKLESYTSDNEIENSRHIGVTPVVTHYKLATLDNKIDFIKNSFDDESSHQDGAKSLGSLKPNGDSSGVAQPTLSAAGISLTLNTPSSYSPSSTNQNYSNKSLSNAVPSTNKTYFTNHDSPAVYPHSNDNYISPSSSPWNQSPSLNHYDSSRTQSHQKFNGNWNQSNRSNQFITKVHVHSINYSSQPRLNTKKIKGDSDDDDDENDDAKTYGIYYNHNIYDEYDDTEVKYSIKSKSTSGLVERPVVASIERNIASINSSYYKTSSPLRPVNNSSSQYLSSNMDANETEKRITPMPIEKTHVQPAKLVPFHYANKNDDNDDIEYISTEFTVKSNLYKFANPTSNVNRAHTITNSTPHSKYPYNRSNLLNRTASNVASVYSNYISTSNSSSSSTSSTNEHSRPYQPFSHLNLPSSTATSNLNAQKPISTYWHHHNLNSIKQTSSFSNGQKRPTALNHYYVPRSSNKTNNKISFYVLIRSFHLIIRLNRILGYVFNSIYYSTNYQ